MQIHRYESRCGSYSVKDGTRTAINFLTGAINMLCFYEQFTYIVQSPYYPHCSHVFLVMNDKILKRASFRYYVLPSVTKLNGAPAVDK